MNRTNLIILLLWTIHPIQSIQLHFIANVSLVPYTPTNCTTIYNVSCHECLCAAYPNASVAVNCFLSNNTCQLFKYFPTRFRLQSTSPARLYFTGGDPPSPSQCCMPNTTLLIQKLTSALTKSIDLWKPRCLVIDDHGFLVTVQEGESDLSRFDPYNLTLIDKKTFSGYTMSNIAYHQGAYFLSTQSNDILIVNSTNRTVINTVTASGISGVRDMIFLKDGQTMIVASADNGRLFFFNRSSISPRDYKYMSDLTTSFKTPHGLWYVNDTFFYATSWEWKNVYSFVTFNGGSTWSETWFANAPSPSNNRWGAHVMIDDCDRRWLSTSDNGLLAYNSQGQLLGTFSPPFDATFDTMFMDNYVMLLSDLNSGKITRLDPQIEC